MDHLCSRIQNLCSKESITLRNEKTITNLALLTIDDVNDMIQNNLA